MGTQRIKNEVEKTKKIIDNLQAHFKQGLNKEGEKVYIEITFNKELMKMLKGAIINEDVDVILRMGYDEKSKLRTKTLKRYRVKRFIFSSLYSQPDFLFLKSLLDRGKQKFEFYDLSLLETFKDYFKKNLQRAISLLLGVEEEKTIKFKIED